MDGKVIKERHMRKWGYVLKDIEYDDREFGGDGALIINEAYTPDGKYIGNRRDALMLCKRMGIRPELRDESHNICSIGFCESDGKWYGWSHRAICGFEVGSTCEPGDCHYVPSDRQDFMNDCTRFWSDKHHKNTSSCEDIQNGVLGVYTTWEYGSTVKNVDLRGEICGIFTEYPDEFGRGSWVAETMGDAKQMAIEFANGAG